MMHEFVTYADGTLVVSSDIRKKEIGYTVFFWTNENGEPIHDKTYR